jgi:hypothetical protein
MTPLHQKLRILKAKRARFNLSICRITNPKRLLLVQNAANDINLQIIKLEDKILSL